jgi:hypothetical protein
MILVLELQVNHTSTGSAAGRINQPAYTGFLSKSTNQPCPLWLDRPDSFNFTSTACAFRKQRITVTIPSYNYLITFFEPTSLLRSYQTIWEESHTFLFHGLSGTVSIDRALSRRLNNIHRILLRAVFWTFYCFTMNTLGWEHRIYHLGNGMAYLLPSNPQEQMGIMSTDHSVSTGMERDTMFLLLLLQYNTCNAMQ